MDARDLFSRLNLFDSGITTASQLWNHLSEHATDYEEILDDETQDIFDTAELVLAEYTGGLLTESEARTRLRTLLGDQGQLHHLQASPSPHARAGD